MSDFKMWLDYVISGCKGDLAEERFYKDDLESIKATVTDAEINYLLEEYRKLSAEFIATRDKINRLLWYLDEVRQSLIVNQI